MGRYSNVVFPVFGIVMVILVIIIIYMTRASL